MQPQRNHRPPKRPLHIWAWDVYTARWLRCELNNVSEQIKQPIRFIAVGFGSLERENIPLLKQGSVIHELFGLPLQIIGFNGVPLSVRGGLCSTIPSGNAGVSVSALTFQLPFLRRVRSLCRVHSVTGPRQDHCPVYTIP